MRKHKKEGKLKDKKSDFHQKKQQNDNDIFCMSNDLDQVGGGRGGDDDDNEHDDDDNDDDDDLSKLQLY